MKKKMAKYGINTSSLQCSLRTRGKEMPYLMLGFFFREHVLFYVLDKLKSHMFAIFLVSSPSLLLCYRVRLDGSGTWCGTRFRRLSHIKSRTNHQSQMT